MPCTEDIQQKLSEFVKQQFRRQGRVDQCHGSTRFERVGETGEARERENRCTSIFISSSRDIRDYLDRFVIRQDDAKKASRIAVCDHYNHVHMVELEAAEKRFIRPLRPARR